MSELEETFLEACDNGDLVKAKACIDLGVNINCHDDQDGDFPLLFAVVDGNMDGAQWPDATTQEAGEGEEHQKGQQGCRGHRAKAEAKV